jgi:hypothetical protein
MSVATSTAIAIAAGVGAAGSLGGALIGGSASKSAAQTQANAASLATQEQARQFNQTQANEAPWLQAGQTSLAQLMGGLQPGGQFATPYSGTFSAPTADQARQTPGYQFSLDEGDKAIERASAASGGAFTGGEAKSLDAFNTGLADQTYQQTFNNSLQSFQTQFNTYNTNQANLYNRLASSSGLGQTTATQLGQLGQTAVANEGNLQTSGAAALAGGQVGAANAYTAGLQGLTNSASGYLQLSSLLNGGQGTNQYAGSPNELSNFDSQGNFIPAATWNAPGTPAFIAGSNI